MAESPGAAAAAVPTLLQSKSKSGKFSECSCVESLASSIDPSHALRRQASVKSIARRADDLYELIEVLGNGGFGIVSKVQCKRTHGFFAMKSIAIDKVSNIELFERELAITRRLKHPYIIRLNQHFQDRDAYHLVMELCTGGDLFQYVTQAAAAASAADGEPSGEQDLPEGEVEPGKGLRCCEVARFLGQMLKGLAYLHNFRFAHRDVKPANFLLAPAANASEAPSLKLVDFGLARSFRKSGAGGSKADSGAAPRMTSVVGTTGYVAPEVLLSKDGYTERCDVWGAGATAWFLAAGARPFSGSGTREYLRAVRTRQPRLRPEEVWGHEHPEALQQAVLSLLEQDPAKRPGAAELLRSAAWLRREACPVHGGGCEGGSERSGSLAGAGGGRAGGGGCKGCCAVQ